MSEDCLVVFWFGENVAKRQATNKLPFLVGSFAQIEVKDKVGVVLARDSLSLGTVQTTM